MLNAALNPLELVTYTIASLRLLDHGKGVSETAITMDAGEIYREKHPDAPRRVVNQGIRYALTFMLNIDAVVHADDSGKRARYRLNGAAFLDTDESMQGLESAP